MIWVFLGLASFLASELFLRLPILSCFKTASQTARKSASTISNKAISDHWKEMILPAYAGRIAKNSVLGLVYLLLALTPFLVIGLFMEGGLSALSQLMLSLPVLLFVMVLSLGYIWIRSKGGDGSSGYSASDRFLHKVALGNKILPEVLHDVEKGMFLKKSPAMKEGAHVFVCSLARAGTTVVLRELHRSGEFASLTYKDMPFVLAPNLWAKIAGNRTIERSERAHGDGIEVDLDSPEALDEVYWRIFDGESYISARSLKPHAPNGEMMKGYEDLISLVANRHGANRYLSKNNNNILRIPALAKHFPNAQFVIPLRDPLQHAASLRRQHRRFLDNDAFTDSYMTWLGHHEFGSTHRPFAFGAMEHSDPDTLEYWLERWIEAHEHLKGVAETLSDQVRFVDSAKLSQDPNRWSALSRWLGLKDHPAEEIRSIDPQKVEAVDEALSQKAQSLYNHLSNIAV